MTITEFLAWEATQDEKHELVGLDQELPLPGLSITLPLAELYEGDEV